MKAALLAALAASLAVGAAVQPHNHRLHHARSHQQLAPPARRALVTDYEYVTDTVYVNVDGGSIDKASALEGLEDGTYKFMGETTPEHKTSAVVVDSSPAVADDPPATPTPTPTPSGAQFLEAGLAKVGKPSPTARPATVSPAPKPAAAPSSSSGATGVHADFPDGKCGCGDFDCVKQYGAVPLENTPQKPWVGYMHVGLAAYSLGQTAAIKVDISEPLSGDPTPGTFVGYACEPGYDPAQWPAAQGAKYESVGGIYCGSDEKLHLTRPEASSKLCQAGAGNVHVVSMLSKPVYICKTWYPGNEGMFLPTRIPAGETVDLYNPLQAESYTWKGMTTSAQYYLNMQDVPVGQACTWTPDSPYTKVAGNWAGMNLGTSVDADGNTFLSIFHNTPTSNAALDYNIKIAGTASGGAGEVLGVPCKYDYGSNAVTGGGNGCTVSTKGGDVYVILSDA